MIYRPNFCCSCGEKVERATWPLLSSRRFCDLCQTDHQATDWIPRIVVIVGLVFGTAGLIALYRPAQHIETITPKSSVDVISRASANSITSQIDATPSAIPQSQTGPVPTETQKSTPVPPLTIASATTAKETDPVYYCGAETKKGTPCTRRVKHAGERCWQHQGMSAMSENAQKIMR